MHKLSPSRKTVCVSVKHTKDYDRKVIMFIKYLKSTGLSGGGFQRADLMSSFKKSNATIFNYKSDH